MRMSTRLINQEGKELDIAIVLEMYDHITVSTEDDISNLDEGEILILEVYGEAGMFGKPKLMELEIEVVKLMSGSKSLAMHRIRGAQ